VTRLDSLVGAAKIATNALHSTIPVSDILRYDAPSMSPPTLLQASSPSPLLIHATDDAHSSLLN